MSKSNINAFHIFILCDYEIGKERTKTEISERMNRAFNKAYPDTELVGCFMEYRTKKKYKEIFNVCFPKKIRELEETRLRRFENGKKMLCPGKICVFGTDVLLHCWKEKIDKETIAREIKRHLVKEFSDAVWLMRIDVIKDEGEYVKMKCAIEPDSFEV